ncbi:MAG: hypothetical protein QNJ07_08360 [Woeseiaceae bacterium]|nr:hypothetical protein [Woeseiaceae bacterium]
MNIKNTATVLILSALTACSPSKPAPDIDELAREYLFLELSMDLHDEGHVDAYFGPEEIRDRAAEQGLTMDAILIASNALAEDLAAVDTSADDMLKARVLGLLARLQALDTRIAIKNGEFLSFDEESIRLFGTVAPSIDDGHFQAILHQIDELVPGDGPLNERVEGFRSRFYVPDDKRAAVFEAALDECRRRTAPHIELPDNESFVIDYVEDKPWGAYNWYKGNAHSLIEVNTDLPSLIFSAVHTGCHEGYPGHHVYNALLEKNLVGDKGWIEFTLYPLFSPQSLIAEGTANYGTPLAFPGDERTEFEKGVLFPLAGLDPEEADRYYTLRELLTQLSYAGNEAARAYLDGDMAREETIDWLMTYGLSTRERAEKSVWFYDTYRSYVINYNWGKDLVAEYIEQGNPDLDERWRRFEKLLSTSVLPADLKVD